MATRRPKRSTFRPNYRDLCNLRLPRVSKQKIGVQRTDSKVYRLNVLEEDESSGLVKISYIGYGSEWDEWRSREDIIELTDGDGDEVDNSGDCVTRPPLQTFPKQPINLYEQLTTSIKSQLVSYRKRSPYCRICINFDCIYFEGLIQRGSVIPRTKYLKQQVYTVTKLSKLNDILGHRWYIRGLNSSGDFCYVKPNTVEFYLQHLSGKTDYQLLSNGTLSENTFGAGYNLVFTFVREDGTLHQWNTVLKECE